MKNINAMNKAELINLLTVKNELITKLDGRIAELEGLLKVANYTIGRYENLMRDLVVNKAEKIQPEIKKDVVQETRKDAPKKPEAKTTKTTTKAVEKPAERPIEEVKKMTREEALEAKYGPIEDRRAYAQRKDAVRKKVEAEILEEVKTKRNGKRYPYKEYCEIRKERVAKRMEELEKAEAEEAAKAKKTQKITKNTKTQKTTAKKTTKR